MVARVEEVGEVNDENKLREIVREETKGKNRMEVRRPRLGGCCGCFLLFLIMSLVSFCFIFFAVGKTGLFNVPVFSRFYNEPKPERLVSASASDIGKTMEDQIGPQVEALLRGRSTSNNISIRLNESDLTRVLRDIATSQPNLGLNNPQVFLEQNEIRIFSRFESNGLNPSTIRVNVRPGLSNGNIIFEVSKFEIGQLPVWHRLVNFLAHTAVDPQLRDFSQKMGTSLKLKELKISDGTLEISGEVGLEALNSLLEQ